MRDCVKLWKIIFALLLLELLSGCWDIKEIQDINYLTAIGIDYEKDNFVLYAQMFDFASIAKAETGKPTEPAQIWIGKTKGRTLDLAMSYLYDSAQQGTSWSHVSSIVISERALKKGVLSNTDTLGRYQEFRMTPWVFGTRDPLDQILTAPAFFNLSALSTISHEPTGVYRQKSYIVPIRYFDFLSGLTEPAFTVLLPSLSIDSSTWKAGNKEDPKLRFNGVFAMSEGKMKGFLTNEKINGLRWVQSETIRSPIFINGDKEYTAIVVLQKPKTRKTMKLANGVPRYRMHIELSGNVVEVRKDFTWNEIEKEAAEEVRKEIFSTFKNGLETKSDLYSLNHLLFKQKTGFWKKLKETSEMLMLDENALEQVTVEVHLDHVGLKLLQPTRVRE